MMGNLGGLVATWTYLPGDAPNFKVASSINVAALITVFLALLLLDLWMNRDNRRKDIAVARAEDVWGAMDAFGLRNSDSEVSEFRWSM